MIPIHDDKPTRAVAIVTISLIIVCNPISGASRHHYRV